VADRAFIRRATDLYAAALKSTQSSFTQETAAARPVAQSAAGMTDSSARVPLGRNDSGETADNKTADRQSEPVAENGSMQKIAELREKAVEAYDRGELNDEELEQILAIVEQQEEVALGHVQRSISYTTDNRPFVTIDSDILAGIPESDWVRVVKENLKQKFPDGITVGRNQIVVNQQSRKEMTFSEYMKWIKKKNPQVFADKLRATNNADEILFATTGWVNEGLNHSRKDNITDFARGSVLLRIGGNNYTAEVVVGTTSGGNMLLYDVINLQTTQFLEKSQTQAIAANSQKRTSNRTPASDNSSVADTPDSVKQQFSFSEPTVSKRDVAADLRAILNRGGDPAELRRYVEQMERGSTKAEHNNDFAERDNDYADRDNSFAEQTGSEAEQILQAARQQGVGVEEYLEQNWERYDVDGQWNDAARQALRLEQDRSGQQYSLSEQGEEQKNPTIDKSESRVSGGNVIDLSADNLLSRRIGDLRGAEKYKVIQQYILEVLQEQPLTLSDGRKAVVDRSDALHIANKSGVEKTAEITEIKRMVEGAVLYAEDANAEHKKFNHFWYYKADVRFKGDEFPLYVNVGKAKNDGSLHIYDITKKIRDTADRINGLERPEGDSGNALESDISTNSIWDEGKFVNRDNETKAPKIQRSLSEQQFDKNSAEKVEYDGEDVIKSLPSKARDYLKRVEGKLLDSIGSALGVSKFADKRYLKETIRMLSNEYLQTGTISDEAASRLFETAYKQGIMVDSGFYTEYKHIKDHLRTTEITISSRDKADIADFADFKKRAFGTLKIVNNGGLPVDTAYGELQSMAKELFPDHITHPAPKILGLSQEKVRQPQVLQYQTNKTCCAFVYDST